MGWPFFRMVSSGCKCDFTLVRANRELLQSHGRKIQKEPFSPGIGGYLGEIGRERATRRLFSRRFSSIYVKIDVEQRVDRANRFVGQTETGSGVCVVEKMSAANTGTSGADSTR